MIPEKESETTARWVVTGAAKRRMSCGYPGLTEEFETGRCDVTELCRCCGLVLPGFRESQDVNVMRLDHVRNGNGTVFVEQRADIEGTEIDVGGTRPRIGMDVTGEDD